MNNKPLSNFEIIKLFIDEVNQKDAMGFHSFLNHLKEKDLSVVKYNEKSINMNDEDTTTLKNQLLKMYMHIYGKDRPNIIAKLEKDLSLAFTNSKNIEHFSEQLNYLLKEKYASYSYSEKEKIKEYFKYILDKVKKVSEFLDKKGEILLNTLFLSKDTENVENSYTEFLKNIITSVKYPQFKILIDKLPKEIAKQHCENYIKLMYKKLKIDNKEVSDKDIINEIENFYYDFNFQKRTLLLLTDILNNYWSDVKNKEVKDYIESVSSYLSSKLHINDKDAMSHLLKIVIENNKQLRILVTKHDIYCKNIKNINNIEKKLDYYIKNIKPNKIPSEYIERLKKDKKKLQKDDDSLKTEIESLKNQFKNQINSYLQTFLIEDEQIEELKEKLGILPKVKEGESSLIANYWNRLWNYSIDSVSGLYNTTKDLVSSAITTTATIGSGYVVGSMAGVALGPLAPMGGIIGAAIALRGKDLAEEVMNRFNSFWEEKKGKFEKYEEDEMFKASLGFKHIFNNESKSEIIRKYFINYLFHIELKLIEAEECNLEDEINNYKKLYAKTLDDWKKINGLYGNLNIEERKKIIKEYFKEEFKNVEQNNIKKAYDKFFDILEIVTTLSPEKLEYSSYEFMLENKSSELELTEIQDNAVNHVEEKGYPLAIYETENEITVFKELQSHANSFYESINYLLDTIEGIDTENSKLPEEVDNLKIQKPSLTTKDKYGHSFLYNKIHNNDNPLFYLNLFLDEEVFIDKNKSVLDKDNILEITNNLNANGENLLQIILKSAEPVALLQTLTEKLKQKNLNKFGGEKFFKRLFNIFEKDKDEKNIINLAIESGNTELIDNLIDIISKQDLNKDEVKNLFGDIHLKVEEKGAWGKAKFFIGLEQTKVSSSNWDIYKKHCKELSLGKYNKKDILDYLKYIKDNIELISNKNDDNIKNKIMPEIAKLNQQDIENEKVSKYLTKLNENIENYSKNIEINKKFDALKNAVEIYNSYTKLSKNIDSLTKFDFKEIINDLKRNFIEIKDLYPLHLAAYFNDVESFKNSKFELKRYESFGPTPLGIACVSGSTEVAVYLYSNKYDKDSNSIDTCGPNYLSGLIVAAENKHFELINELLKKRVEANFFTCMKRRKTNAEGRALMHYIFKKASENTLKVYMETLNKNEKIEQHVNIKDFYGNTPLHMLLTNVNGSKAYDFLKNFIKNYKNNNSEYKSADDFKVIAEAFNETIKNDKDNSIYNSAKNSNNKKLFELIGKACVHLNKQILSVYQEDIEDINNLQKDIDDNIQKQHGLTYRFNATKHSGNTQSITFEDLSSSDDDSFHDIPSDEEENSKPESHHSPRGKNKT